MTDERIIQLRKATGIPANLKPFADSLAFARAIEEEIHRRLEDVLVGMGLDTEDRAYILERL